MKLLLDQNLSPRLAASLRDVYPSSTHGFAIVSKDADFHQRSFLLGPPPKVIYIRFGNCSTRDIEGILKAHRQDLQKFEREAAAAFLVLE